MLLSPWSSLHTARGPAWALLSSVCVRGTMAPVPAPLLHPSSDGGLSCSSPDETQGRAKLPALRSQRCPHDQELRHGCPALTPVNTVTTQGGYTGQRQSLRTAGVRWDPFHRYLGWQSWVLHHSLIYPHSMPAFPSQWPTHGLDQSLLEYFQSWGTHHLLTVIIADI